MNITCNETNTINIFNFEKITDICNLLTADKMKNSNRLAGINN